MSSPVFPSQTASAAQQALRVFADAKKGGFLARFFKTGPGQYGHGDVFLGVTVPVTRRVAREFRELPRKEITALLASEAHEDRLLALVILTTQFDRGDDTVRDALYAFYLKHRKRVNNWDLVDVSAARVVGAHLFETGMDRGVLYDLARARSMWDRRIAIIATHYFIRRDEFTDTLRIAEMLLDDHEDLMHKAVGWMLREVGKRDGKVLRRFLDKHVRSMPRTTLRYAIERFPENERKRYLHA